jgi:hypothetical protein
MIEFVSHLLKNEVRDSGEERGRLKNEFMK